MFLYTPFVPFDIFIEIHWKIVDSLYFLDFVVLGFENFIPKDKYLKGEKVQGTCKVYTIIFNQGIGFKSFTKEMSSEELTDN